MGSILLQSGYIPHRSSTLEVYIQKQKDPRGKVARWLVELENFDYKVEYVLGKDNVEADYLSRIEIPEGSNEPEGP